MTIVSNTSPLCYLVLIGHAPILPKLYDDIATTETVLAELRHADAPPAVRTWAAAPPEWLKIHPDPVPRDNTLADLDPGSAPPFCWPNDSKPTWCCWMKPPPAHWLANVG